MKVVVRLFVAVLIICIFSIWTNPRRAYAIQCGDGVREGLEECDNGTNNSDTQPDKCRTDCTMPDCGDYVIDSGEECDDGSNHNSDEIPGACRRNCKRAHCGDGVMDIQVGEECDDGNNNAQDGCHQCFECYKPKDNLSFGNYPQYVKLCQGRYEFTDEGYEGILIVNGTGVTLDCQGATLVGKPFVMDSVIQGAPAAAAVQGLKKNIGGRKTKKRKNPTVRNTQPNNPPSNPPNNPPGGTLMHQGTGIVVNGQDVVIMNCNIEGFKQGIKLKSSGAALVNNRVCGNQNDIKSEGGQNYGVKNSCSKHQNWQENGNAGCTSVCN